MKETVNSLRAYFLVVALFGVSNTKDLAVASSAMLAASHILGSMFLALTLATAILTGAYFYLAVGLPGLLLRSPEVVDKIILASMAAQVLGFLLSLAAGSPGYVSLVLGLVVT